MERRTAGDGCSCGVNRKRRLACCPPLRRLMTSVPRSAEAVRLASEGPTPCRKFSMAAAALLR